jgi:hypothetical protein
METEFYRSPSGIVPTFSLALAVTMASLNPPHKPFSKDPFFVSEGDTVGSSCAYYYSVEDGSNELQLETIRQFADSLAALTQDTPQEIVDILNSRFWELV